MTFAQEMSELKEILTNQSHNVTAPAEIHRHLNPNNTVDNKAEKLELNVIKNYFEEIKQTDAILIINK
ncbi:hypothetical protein HN587_00345 [Candidatus Woesearchaeota archaeon]|jgi:hypothetical protein|nr:hypothetical protein [Candidatus Woesearchaeota archaeon]